MGNISGRFTQVLGIIVQQWYLMPLELTSVANTFVITEIWEDLTISLGQFARTT